MDELNDDDDDDDDDDHDKDFHATKYIQATARIEIL